MDWKKNFRIDYAALFRIIVRDSVLLVCKSLSAAVSGGGNGTPALTAFDNFDTAMIDCHTQNPFNDGWHNNATRKGFGEHSSPLRSNERNGLAERTAPVRVYKCAISIITLMERDDSLASLLQICFDLFACHGNDFGKDAFQNGPALNESVRPRFAFRVGFPVQ